MDHFLLNPTLLNDWSSINKILKLFTDLYFIFSSLLLTGLYFIFFYY